MKRLSNEELLAELEVPFPVEQVLWRVTNTANNRTRGQVVPYAYLCHENLLPGRDASTDRFLPEIADRVVCLAVDQALIESNYMSQFSCGRSPADAFRRPN